MRIEPKDPKPGSDKAIKQGCSCPALDNHHGKGIGGMGEDFGYWINADCPLHGLNQGIEDEQDDNL